jgi:queuine tRNA-ribosyltransferase
MPVGTYGTVKGVLPRDLEAMGAQIILGNTFHLWMRPGLDVLTTFGGLHRFEGWSRPMLTDSGGFQVWSLGEMRKISEEGVRFASPVNGDKLFLTPEVSMQIQTVLNSDIVMQFDECTPYETAGHLTTEPRRARRWSSACAGPGAAKDEFAKLENPNALFGIVQGGMFENLREASLEALVELDLPGYAVGGVSVGEPKDDMLRIMAHTPHRLPAHKPRYLMGVGTPEDLVEGVANGVDMFDCVMPTRNARNGHLFTRFGDLKMRNARHDRRAPARPHLRLPHLRPLQPRLPAPPRALRRDAGADAGQHPQPALLREPDARGPRCPGRRALRGLPGAVPRRPAARHRPLSGSHQRKGAGIAGPGRSGAVQAWRRRAMKPSISRPPSIIA